jgi:hypothetical protein
MEVKAQQRARAAAARRGLKEAPSNSRGPMNKNRIRQSRTDERAYDREVHIHQVPGM